MKALWKGHLPLARAFWEYAVFYVTRANLCATAAALGALAAGLPAALAIAIFLLPVPYIVASASGGALMPTPVLHTGRRGHGSQRWGGAV